MPINAVTIRCPQCGKLYDLTQVELGQTARCQCGCAFDIAAEHIVSKGSPATAGKSNPAAAVKAVRRGGQSIDPSLSDEAIETVKSLTQAKAAIMSEVGKVIVGQREVLDQIITAFFAQGHCLLMGVPGLAKTMMVHSLAQAMLLDFKRIQFTPDLMPTDITGTNILEEDPETRQRRFTFCRGPIFTNVLLADEINRTPPKTQAALLEAMQEQHVTASGQTYQLPGPFLVLATQNPLEQEGTYPLPEAQLDRFIFLVKVDYPSQAEEQEILLSTTGRNGELPRGILDAESIVKCQQLVRQVPVSEHVGNYATRLCRATRPGSPEAPDFINQWVRYGCGPRAGQSLLLAAKAHVVLNGRFNVSCADIKQYALPVMRHRVFLNFAAASEGLDADAVITKLLATVGEAE